MPFDPQQCQVLLVGKLMMRLEPFLKSKGYPRVDAEELGGQALTRLSSASYHLVLFDLLLGDIELSEFLRAARERQRDAAFIVCASPTDAEMVVSGLVLGADTYVPLPPDEAELFGVLERQGAAALGRKNANPDAQPGVSTEVAALEGELEKARAQIVDLEEQNALFDAELARLNKLLEAARSEVTVPPGQKVVEAATFDELMSKATFAEFLESENDELKRERDALLTRLKDLGLTSDEGDGDDAFDEPTSAMHLDEELLARAGGAPAGGPMAPSPVISQAGDEDEGIELLLEDDGEEIVLVDDGGEDLVLANDDDGDLMLAIDEGEDLVHAEEASPFDDETLSPNAPPIISGPAPAPFEPPPTASVEPPHVPPPGVDDSGDDFDDFEDVNTDALLRLAGDLSKEASSPDELEKLLASLDEE